MEDEDLETSEEGTAGNNHLKSVIKNKVKKLC